MIFALKLTLDR